MKIRLYCPDGYALLYTDCQLDVEHPHTFTGLSPFDMSRKTRVRVTTALPYVIEEEFKTTWKYTAEDILASSPITERQ